MITEPQLYFVRFNSQRDGILQNIHIAIPISMACFNSQRDGILRINSTRKRTFFIVVSIPNGMEFYLYCIDFF